MLRRAGLAAGLAVTLCVPVLATAQESAAAVEVMPMPTLDETAGTVINMILVRVNGDPILLSELRERADGQLEILRAAMPEEEIQAQLPAIRMNLLRGMIDEIMMAQRAERLGIIIGANDVDRWVQQVRESNGFATDAELEAELVSIGMSMEALREQARKQLAQQRLVFEEVQRAVFVTETQIQEYYSEHADEFRTSEEVRLEQLVFIGASAELAEQAAAAAQELQAGGDLETVGGKYVDATPMADTGTFIAVSDLTNGLIQAVPDLQTGTYSDPVATDFGLSIVKVIERTEQQTSTIDDVRENIRNRLTAQRSQERYAEYMSDLRVDTRIDIMDPRLAGLDDVWKTQEAEDVCESNSWVSVCCWRRSQRARARRVAKALPAARQRLPARPAGCRRTSPTSSICSGSRSPMRTPRPTRKSSRRSPATARACSTDIVRWRIAIVHSIRQPAPPVWTKR